MRIVHQPALDGLRGVAVAVVVVYHLAPGLLPGGFLGVDVFFVLSGFLIGSLLFTEAAVAGGIDLRNFYVRRIRRLMPASLLLLAATVLYSATLAGAAELSRLRSHILWTLGWVANWGYISDGTSYIDLVAGSSPLRHTWSLSIEEQFYVVFPLAFVGLMFVSRRRGTNHLRALVGWSAGLLMMFSALAMALVVSGGDRVDRAYYGSDTRFQAILAGVVLAAMFVGRPPTEGRAARVARSLAPVAAAGLVMLFVAAGERDIWMYRGGFTLAAVVSAVLISGVSAARWLGTCLSWRPLAALGRISYGVYLWHWPIVVVVNESRAGVDGPALASIRLFLTMAMAIASGLLLERPIRRGILGRRLGTWVPVVTVGAVVVVAGSALLATSTPDADHAESRPAASTTPGADPIRVLLAGDSVAHTLAGAEVFEFPDYQQWQPGDSPFDPDRVTLATMTRPACSFLAGATVYATPTGTADITFAEYCGDWRRDVGETVEDFRPEFVVVLLSNDATDRRLYGDLLAVGSDGWQTLLDDALDEFRRPTEEIGSVLVLLTPPPRVGRYVASDDRGGWREAEFALGLRSYASRRPGVVVLDLAGAVCPDGDCSNPSAGFDPSWRYDGWHFGGGGPAWVATWLTNQLAPMR